MSGGSKRSSVVSDSNESNVDSSSLGILSPTDMQSNGSLSASINSIGSMQSSFQGAWSTCVSRGQALSSTHKTDISIDDIEADDTLAEDTTSTATLSSNPSSSYSSLPRKTQCPAKKMSMCSMVPRPTGEKVARCSDILPERIPNPKRVHRFHLDTETVKEIESLDSSEFDSFSTNIPILFGQNQQAKFYNLPPSRIPSRLPRKVFPEPNYPDVSEIFLARTEELLKSSRSKSGKKRRHTTNIEPSRELLYEPPTSNSEKKPLNTFSTKLTESPPPIFDHLISAKSFALNEVDGGIGSSMPSSVISNNSMITSQDICISQYEIGMESSGVFSDADPGRKSSSFADPVKIIPEEKSTELEYTIVPDPDIFQNELVSETCLPEFFSGQPLSLPEYSSAQPLSLPESDISAELGRAVSPANVELAKEKPVSVAKLVKPDSSQEKSKETTPQMIRKERSSLSRETRSRAPQEALPKGPGSQEAKGLATKRSELLQEKPIVPNTNVGSKLKEILARQPSPAEKSDQPRGPGLPGKWDAIMNSIAEGQKRTTDTGLADRVRDVKGKVFADFKPPIIRKPRSNTTPDRVDKDAYSRSNSTMSSASNAHVGPFLSSRSSSNMSSIGARGIPAASRSNSHCSGDSSLLKKGKITDSRSNSLCSNASSGKGSEVTLKGQKASNREKSSLTLGPRVGSASKDVSKPSTTATTTTPPIANGRLATVRKTSAPAQTSRKLSTNTKVVPTNAKVGPVGPNPPKGSSTTSQTATAAKNLTNASNTVAANYHQPDLVKVSSPAPQHDFERENLQLKQRLAHNAKGFSAMAVALNHVTKESSLDSKILRQELTHLRQVIQDQNNLIANLRESYNNDLSKYKNSIQECDLMSRLQDVQDQHKSFVEKLLCDHQHELERIKESHRLDLIRLGEDNDEVTRQLESRYQSQLEEAESRWKSKLSQKFDCQSAEICRQESELERREEQWAEAKRALEDQIHLLKAELKEREEEIITKHKGDSLLRSTTNKLTKITAEVDSLKAVLEMKSEELRNLRADKIRLEEKLVDFDQMQAALKKTTALVEDLKAQIDAKNNLERKLSHENRRLHQSMERELHERKKLSQENEELHWRIRTSFSNSTLEGAPLTTSLIDYQSGSPSPMFASLQQSSMSSSFTTDSGCPHSLPSFNGRPFSRNGSHRPVSAPPGKYDFVLKGFTSTPQQSNLEPDSPRVLEVVEKTESVSWKIEYNEMESELFASPNLKRKLSPHSPMSIRKSTRNGRNHPANDVMSRSMIDNRSCSSPFSDVMARSCVTLSRSSSNSSRKKAVPHFEPLNENENETSFGGQMGSEKSTNSSNLSSISDGEDIGDISSSSEIEINEPVVDVTTPQIEAMQFLFASGASNAKLSSETSSPDAELTLRDDLAMMSSSASGSFNSVKKQRARKTESVMSKSMQCNGTPKPAVMSNSLPTYDLQRLFRGPADVLQDSGGESLMARFEEEDPLVISGMTDSTSTESDDPMGMAQDHQTIAAPFHGKRQQSMAESLTGVSWSEDFDQAP